MQTGARTSPIETLLRPRSVAFVGVSARGGGAGVKMMELAGIFGFDGKLWPIHPSAPEIGGRKAFKTLADTPEPPDCVVVAVPADGVLKVLEDAAAAHVKSALVVSEGFADAANDEGRARQNELVAFAKRTDMAIAGPNCMGIASFAHHYAATMADLPDTAVAGGVSLVSQSGGLLNAFAELCGNRGLGMNYLISMGNQAVVDLADYIDFLVEDEATSVIALIMEGAKSGRRLRAAIMRAAPKKPIVVLKLGRSVVGQAATLAHTGTLAGKHEAFEALFKQNGVALVDSIDELVETAGLFSYAPLPKGDRVAIFTVSGGATSLMGDLGDKAGVHFPPIAEATNKKLQEIIEVDRSFNNPIDTVGMPRLRRGDNMARLLEALNADDDLDIVGLALGMRTEGAESHDALVEDIAKAMRAAQHKKPLVVVSFVGGSLTKRWRGYAAQHGVPILDNPEISMRALRHLVDYGAYRRRLADAPAAAKSGTYAALHLPGGKTLTEAESKIILGKAGLPVTKEALAKTPAEAVELWHDIQAPVALKIQSPDIPHKSDVGGVYLGARTAADVEKAAAQVLENSTKACPNAVIDGILVQEMVEDGVEFILGMTYDDQFGPLVVLGSGGVMVEIFKDAAVRLPPLSPEDVRGMIGELKASKLLEGFRGAAPRDVEALVDCCVRFADFVAATDGQFAAIDLNPVFVCPRGKGVRIADALIVTRDAREDCLMGESRRAPFGASAGRTRGVAVLVAIGAAALVAVQSTAATAQEDMLNYKGADREQKLLDGAKKEGQLNFYSAMIVNQALRPIADGFMKKYPFIKLSYWRAETEDIVAKLSAEERANNVVGDVIEGTGVGESADAAGLVQPYYTPEIEQYPADERDPHGLWTPTRLSYFSAAYNTKMVAADQVPKSYEALLDPKWQGKMAWRIGTSTGTPLFITNLRMAWGEDKAMAYFQKLKDQKIINFGSGSARTLVDRTMAGEYPIALNIFAHHPLISKAKGAPVDSQLMDPVPTTAATMGIPKGTHHPNAAMLFIDYILSKEGQQIMAQAEYFPSLPDVPPLPMLAPVIPKNAGVTENFVSPENLLKYDASSEKIYEDLFR